METYISILRGINVGGKTIKMNDLRKIFEKLGFKNVSTYIQSGNVFFQTQNENPEVLEQNIRKQIQTSFGMNVSVIVFTPAKLEQIIHSNPFKDDAAKDPKFMHVTFLQTKPEKYTTEAIESKKSGDEEIGYTNEAVYLYCPNGYGKSKLNNTLFENKLKVTATTRNWKTTNKLLELAKSMT